MASSYSLPSSANKAQRLRDLKEIQSKYFYDTTGLGTGLTASQLPPVSNTPYPLAIDGFDWIRNLLGIGELMRQNYRFYQDSESAKQFKFAYGMTEFAPLALTKFVADWISPEVVDKTFQAFHFFVPDFGYGVSNNRPKSIDDFHQIFRSVDKPNNLKYFDQDAYFAWNFLGGPNPSRIALMNQIPTNFPISDAHFQKVPAFANDSLSAAISDGRVFIINYPELSALRPGKYAVDKPMDNLKSLNIPKYTYSPIAAFALPKNGGGLLPFAIQCDQNSASNPIFTPDQGPAWKIARNILLAAHNTYHEAIEHLGFTHLVMESIALTTERQLHIEHPVNVLLRHHTEGTQLINRAAITNLIMPGSYVDQLIGADIKSVYPVLQALRADFSYTGHYLRKVFDKNQTSSSDRLVEYPYRDDGLLVWDAISKWMTQFVQTYYPDDATVATDSELQAWANELSTKIRDFGATPGKITSKQDLTEILTMAIWIAGPRHAAVNFTQLTEMAFTPANPLGVYRPAPTDTNVTEKDYLDSLPPLEVQLATIGILYTLAGCHYTRLGTYGKIGIDKSLPQADFTSGPIADRLADFNTQLASIEGTIKERNTTRQFRYIHLIPSRIPQSINI